MAATFRCSHRGHTEPGLQANWRIFPSDLDVLRGGDQRRVSSFAQGSRCIFPSLLKCS
jgi:hypothetical protein